MKRRRKYTFQAILMLFSLFMLFVVAYIAYLELKPMVVKAVTMEAGSPMVDAKEFLLEKDQYGRYITDINNLDLNTPGVYEIKIKVRNRIHTSTLEVVDHTPPTAETVDVMALKGEEVKAEAFVTNVIDATTVKISFANTPNTEVPGNQEVILLLEDTSNNSTKLTANLTVLDIKSYVQIEAGTVMDITPQDYVDHSRYHVSFVTDLKQLDISKPTTHEIQIIVDGRILTSYIHVVDTTPPMARTVDQVIWMDETIEAGAFVKDVSDASEVHIFYKEAPSFITPGVQEVVILVEDTYGNKKELKALLTIKEDTEAPVFTGIRDKTVYVGEAVSYKKGISVSDNKDKELSFQADSSKVNLYKEGVYKVYYSAIDLAGNKAEAVSTVTVMVLVVTDEMMNELADQILNDITDVTMTKREKAYKIYKYVKGHVAYTGDSDKSDVKAEAYRGIKNAIGDCFTYYAVSEVLLTRAGIDNMRVTRVGGRTQHFWNLINCGEGWYHFDSCPNKDKSETFMMTDAQVKEYTKKRGNNYYNFDQSLYPATPLE